MKHHGNRRGPSNSLLAVLLATFACNQPPPHPKLLGPDAFPAVVGPPFGLDALDGGMTGQQVTDTLSKLGSGSERLGWTLRNDEEGIVGKLSFNDGRLGDIVFTFRDCEYVTEILNARWGRAATTTFGEAQIWESPSSHWVASTDAGARCRLVFTSSDFFGPVVAAPGQLARLRPGVTRSDATRVIHDDSVELDGISDGRQAVAYDPNTDRVLYTDIILPAPALIALRRAWGDGTVLDDGEPRTVWYDRSSKVRARLDHMHLIFDDATAWQEWLGDGPTISAVGSVLGKSIEDLRRERRVAFRNDYDARYPLEHIQYWLQLSPMEWDPESTSRARLHFDHGVVTSVATTLRYTTPAIRDQMLGAFAAKWGASTVTREGVDFCIPGSTIHVLDMNMGFEVNMESSR